ncbi:MAG: glycosyltransferase family 4 protein [Acidimicrobiales bacterium]|nr:glycosyltransferase family 4 protein [Acidimicrobiales bacterium]
MNLRTGNYREGRPRAVKPRALLLSLDYAPQTGGQPRLITAIVEATADMVDWKVITAAPGAPDERVVRAGGMRSMVTQTLRARRWLDAADDRLVVSAHAYLGPLAHVVGLLSKAPVSTLCYGRELVPANLAHRLALSTLRLDHKVVTISRHSQDVVRGLGVKPQHSAWVGCELKPRFTRPGDPSPRTQAGLHAVAVTRLCEGYKNLEVTLRAVALLVADGTVEHYTIVGDGPRRASLQRRIDRLGLGEHVTLAGRLDDRQLGDLLQTAHVGLFPSRVSRAEGGFEGFGIVVQEFAAAGLPVIVGDVGGAGDAARTEWAKLVQPDDLAAWVDALDELARDEPLRMSMAQAAHRFGQTLDTATTARSFLDALRGVPAPTPISRRNLLGVN